MRYLPVLLSLLAAGCARPSPPPAAGGPTPSSGERFVLIWTDAALHRSPDDTAPVRAHDYGDEAREARAGQVHVARLVADHGDWIEVDTGPIEWIDDARRPFHCSGSNVLGRGLPAGWGEVALRMWVRRADLAPVLDRPFERSFDDGTFVKLRPGTPIVGGRPWIDGFLLPVEVPSTHVGTAYAALPPMDGSATAGFQLQDAVEVRATLGGVDAPWAQPPWDYSDPPYVWIDGTGTRIATGDAGCGQVVLAFTGEAAVSDSGSFGVGGLGGPRVPGVKIPTGTRLGWANGQPAGVVVDDLHLRVVPTSETLCFDVQVGMRWKSPGYLSSVVEVCAPASAATPFDMPSN